MRFDSAVRCHTLWPPSGQDSSLGINIWKGVKLSPAAGLWWLWREEEEKGGVVIQLCLHIPLSRADRRANHPAKLNEHSLMKSVCIFIFLWGTNNGVSARVRMQTCYAQLMTVVAVLWVMFIVVDICLPIRRPLYVFVFHLDRVHAIKC